MMFVLRIWKTKSEHDRIPQGYDKETAEHYPTFRVGPFVACWQWVKA